MKILFVTGVYTNDTEDYLRKKSGRYGLQNAANTYQWGVIKGILENTEDITVVSYPFVPFSPFRSKIWKTPNSSISYKGKVVGGMESFVNFFLIKEYSITHRLKKYVRNWVKRNMAEGDEQLVVLFYSLSTFFINAIMPLKKEIPGLKVCAIVTDMVEDDKEAYHHNFIQKVLVRRESFYIKKSYEIIDKFILLTENMKERIPRATNSNIVIEGIYSDEVYLKSNTSNTKWRKTLLYTGSLMPFTGILELLNAFIATTDPDFRLIICGYGDCLDNVKQASQKDSRIIYKGVVKRDKAIEYQGKVTALINPRRPISNLTKYSFPSKTIEYLASGTPMIGYKLEGIPSEYYSYYYAIEGLSLQDLTDTITKVLCKDERELKVKGESARQFIVNYKSAAVQGKKIIQFLKQ